MVQPKLVKRISGPAPPRCRPYGLVRAARAADLVGRPKRSDLWRVTVKSSDEEEVIDLGAPRKVRAARCPLGPAPRVVRAYTPNPRLYPGPQRRQKCQIPIKQKRKAGRRNPKKNVYRRPVPNSRLYRPAPPRPLPPPATPRTVWRPPPQGKLDTASHVALRLNQGLYRVRDQASEVTSIHALVETPAKAPKTVPGKPKSNPTRKKHTPSLEPPRLVVKLPAAAGDGNSSKSGLQYRPNSRYFRDRQLGSRDSTPTGGRVPPAAMATPRHSTSPEDCSEGNDSQSAPSEFLAEFLSAIMRRQYAEALKYCRLILQYEPRNATARGFYPLLQQKVAQQSPTASDKPAPPRTRHPRARANRSPDLVAGGASSGANSGNSSPVPQGLLPHELMQQEADSLSCSSPRPASAASSELEPEPGLGSGSSQSSLELDYSPACSSPSLSLSRRTDSASASGTWDSSGSARDDNGNPAPAASSHSYACDAENNPPLVSTVSRSPRHARAPPLTLQSEQSSESLRRLRAQFACSIK